MKFVISRYNQDIEWVKEYTDDIVLYDRSETPLEGSIIVPNIGSDIYDKFTYIIDNYDNLPDIAVYTKANLFNYITKEEFEEKLKTGKFEPLLTKNHKTYLPVCFYSEDGMYNEINNRWYLNDVPHKNVEKYDEMIKFKEEYKKFAPGTNYIIPKENILKHPKEFYEKLRDLIRLRCGDIM